MTRPRGPTWRGNVGLDLTRKLLAHEPFTTAGRLAYLALAELAARELARLPGVDGVYLGGSIRSASAFAPGHSDLDLYVVAQLGTPERERALADALVAWLGRRRWLRVFKHVDVGSIEELSWMRRDGGGWAIDLDRRFRCLAGTNRLEPSTPARPPGERRIVEVAEAMRRFTKASPILLDRTLGRPREVDARGSRRLLADVLAALLGRDRLDPLDELLDVARGEESLVAFASRHLATDDGRDADVARVAAAGGLLESHARDAEHTALRAVAACPDDRRDAAGRRAAQALGLDGWVAVERVALGGAAVRFAVGGAGVDVDDCVRRIARGHVRTDDGALPTPVSRELFTFASWLDPFPIAGDALVSLGDGWTPEVAEVPGDVARTLARARLAAAPRRARGRRLRAEVDSVGADGATRREIAIGLALADAIAAGTPSVVRPIEAAEGDIDAAIDRLETRVVEVLLSASRD